MIQYRKPIGADPRPACVPRPQSRPTPKRGHWRAQALALAAALLAGSGHASEQLSRQVQARCEADPLTQTVEACIRRATNDLDGVIFLRLMHLKEFECPPLATTIDEAQWHWLDYRDTHCGLYRETVDEAAAELGAALCQLRLTITREQELDSFSHTRPRSRVMTQ
jgi:uncharacterized protein YecT (DUF1311 family)